MAHDTTGEGKERKTEDKQEKTAPPNSRDEMRALLAEVFGTFALTFVAAGGLVIKDLSHDQVTYVARVGAPGLLVMAMIYAIGDISGAHINPAVTLAFALRGAFAWVRVPRYWAAQLLGAVLAALVLRGLFGEAGHLGNTLPHFGDMPALVMEVILTLFLVSVIIGTAEGSKIVGPNAGMAVGATVALCGLFADPVSGASMNPARSLGPALVSGELSQVWIYLVGPALGSIAAVILAWVLKGAPNKHEAEAASGEKSGETSDADKSAGGESARGTEAPA